MTTACRERPPCRSGIGGDSHTIIRSTRVSGGTPQRAFPTALVLSLLLAAAAQAEFPAFRVHQLNPEATFTSCAAVDVDHDGKLDVISGGWWYQAPDWKKHFLREVETIRGRYDDYSNLPLDVNGDGWTDIISANYRSETLYWIEHPGAKLGPWTAHVIEKPGPMETARLFDIDGDGRLDILPNGTQFAAWWELITEPTAVGPASFRWTRHELPSELAAHGVGFGDIDGDGRGDLVSPAGWMKSPEDPRRGRWLWQPEFHLHRDGSIPMLVFDVDADGDNDLVYGRGHQTGLYWVEQVREASARRWVRHAIDTSWSQAHSLMLGDVDNDGRIDLVAGKRFLGHDGRDLGEWDPMVIYAYTFDPRLRTWTRNTITSNDAAGFDLDPKLTDIDGDGDLDIIGATRKGLFLVENLLGSSTSNESANPPAAPTYADHSKLLVFKDSAGKEQSVENYADWGRRRAHILDGVQQAMGELPDSSRRVPVDMQVVEEAETPHYIRRKITFAVEPGDRVPAWLLMPRDRDGRRPAMLCLHQTTKIGKDEPAGLGGQKTLHYAHELAERGYVCLVPDYPSFGEYSYDFQKARGQWYASGSMKAVWNNIRAVDLLESLPEVDTERIGVIGHSLGGHNAIFTAALDQRIHAVVSSCGFTAFHSYYGGKLAGWTSDRYMPRIRDVYGNDPNKVPFDFHELVAAIAPRPFFSNSPIQDSNFDVEGVRQVEAAAREVYELVGANEQLTVLYPDVKHDFPDDVRTAAYEWLDKQMKN